ncbi:MAG: bile acid-coenzyme ligase [Solirubrobacteraceae bacterium]
MTQTMQDPDQAAPIGELLRRNAARAPDAPAVTCEASTVTYGELEAGANRLARAYADLGVAEGDFVSIGLPNGPRFVLSCYAAWKLGATPQPVSPRLPARELAQIIETADPALVVGFPPEIAGGRTALDAGFRPDRALSAAPLPPRVSPSWKAPTSGGSTGRPKLIVAGRPGRFDPVQVGARFQLRPGQTQLVPGPLYHNAPFFAAMVGSFLGQHVVVLPRFDPQRALELIDRHRVTYISLVPTMLLRMLRAYEEDPDRYDIRSLEVVWHTAAPCPAWLKRRWIELLGPERIFEAYGATEGQAATMITGTEWLAKPGSVGRPMMGEIAIVDEDGAFAPPMQIGSVVMRSSTGAAPTYRYVGASTTAFADGWESVGDAGYLDADGYLFLVDRHDDVILSGGANIFPAEVESAILEHPLVLSAAVVGLPDDDLGQRAHAAVEAAPGLDEDELREFLSSRLVRYKIPRSFRIGTDPLRDDAGKVRRKAIREREVERQQAQGAPAHGWV